jgi:hypothetical protein
MTHRIYCVMCPLYRRLLLPCQAIVCRTITFSRTSRNIVVGNKVTIFTQHCTGPAGCMKTQLYPRVDALARRGFDGRGYFAGVYRYFKFNDAWRALQSRENTSVTRAILTRGLVTSTRRASDTTRLSRAVSRVVPDSGPEEQARSESESR